MSSEVDQLIAVGHEITAGKYYIIATCTVLFYDYFLTLGDEVKYAWSGKRSWAFWIFLLNRYFPMSYQVWLLSIDFFTPHFNTTACNKTAFYSILAFVTCTLLAQVVLTIRIYAVAMKNIYIAIGLGAITVSQLALGIYMMAVAGKEGAQPLPQIPLDAYHLCVFFRHRKFELAYTSISIFYDSLAFLLIMFLATGLKRRGLKVRNLMETITADATRYFLVIFSAHFVLVLTLNLGPEPVQLLPGPGLPVFLPVMISRIMFSLKKAADSQNKPWTLTEPAVVGPNFQRGRPLIPRRRTNEMQNDIPLETYTGA